jgi:hypothetical protein
MATTMIRPENQNLPATEKQVSYVGGLILRHRIDCEKAAKSAGAMEGHEQQAQVAQTLASFYAAITVPSDLTQQQASNWINLLNRGIAGFAEYVLGSAKMQARTGVAAYVAAHRNEIEYAVSAGV